MADGARTNGRKNEKGGCASQVSSSCRWQTPDQNWRKGTFVGSRAWEGHTSIRVEQGCWGCHSLCSASLCWAHCLPLQTAEHTQRHRYTETETLVTTHMCLSGGLPWPCPGLVGIGAGATSGRKARSLVWGRLAGIDSGASPPQTGMFSCAQAVAGSQPCPVPSDSTLVTTPLTAGEQACPVALENREDTCLGRGIPIQLSFFSGNTLQSPRFRFIAS